MATDYRQKAKDLSDNWKEIAQQAGLDPTNKNWSREDLKEFRQQRTENKKNKNSQTAASEYVAGQVPTVSKIDLGDGQSIDVLTQSGDPALDISNATAISQNLLDANLIRITGQQVLANTQEETRRATEVAGIQNLGIGRQAEATEAAAREAAGATRFAATEGARAAIESQRVQSQSLERQIGLKGAQDRLLAVEQGSQERLNIRATGEQQRLTQGQLLGGQERQIGLTGEQQRLTTAETGKQERLGITTTGAEQRSTQAQLLAGQERQIEMTGAQQRLLAQEQGRQQRETEMQAEMNRRYKEAKDAAQAARAFRA